MEIRIPPQSIDSEKAVLGSMLQDKTAQDIAFGILTGECFYLDAHKLIFQAMSDLHQGNSPIDMVTITQKLADRQQLDEIGGASFISGVADRVPTASNIEYYSNIVKDKYIKRLIISNATNIIDKSYSESGDVYQTIDEFQSKILLLGSEESSDYSMEKLMNSDISSGVPIITGFHQFDKFTGGFWRKDLVIIAGRTSMGKTALALSFALSIARSNIPVSFFSLEMSEANIKTRFLSMESKVKHENIRYDTLSDEQRYDVLSAKGRLIKYPITLNTKSNWNIHAISAKIRKLHREGKCEIAFVDFLTYMDIGDSGDRYDLRVGEITRLLKSLGKELNIPIILLAQLSRKPDDRQDHRPAISDIKESSSIEQHADMILFPYRNYVYTYNDAEINDAELIIAKHRNGRIGTLKDYRYYGDIVTYEEMEIWNL